MLEPESASAPLPRPAMLDRVLFALCMGLSLLGVILADFTLIFHDMAGIIGFAQEIALGRKLYVDMFTSQFPFIIYLMKLPLAIHSLLGFSIADSFFIFVFLVMHASMLLSWRIICRHPLCQGRARYALLFVLTYGLFILPLQGEAYRNMFGQREHLFYGLILPYIMLALNRMQGIEASRGTKAIAGLMAAAGFCIKPHFALVFILSELFTMDFHKKFFAWSRIDAWIIILFCTIYYALMVTFTPEYFALIPKISTNYQGYRSTWPLIFSYMLFIFIIPAAVTFACRHTPYSYMLRYLLRLIIAGGIIFAVQKCGYPYQAFPIFFFTLLICTLALLIIRKPIYTLILVPFFAIYVCSMSFFPDASAFLKRREGILAEAAIMAPYKNIAVLTSDMWALFPMATYSGGRMALSAPYLEYLPSIYMQYRGTFAEPPYNTLEKMPETERFFHEHFIRDMQRLPEAVLVDESPRKVGFERMKFDFLTYFMQDERFREVWSHYELAQKFDKTRPFALYLLKK